MVDKDTFLSMSRKDYKWPYSKPLIAKPSQPSPTTKSKNAYVKGPVDAYCHCDGHLYDPLLNRYLKLTEKEKLLHEELMALNHEMANLNNEILEHECDSYNDKMETTYAIDFAKRGSPNSGKVERIRIRDSPEKTTEQPDPSFFHTASKSCLKSDLAMMLDSSSEDGSQEETSDNSDLGDILKKELLQYRNKKKDKCI
ncbi:hypothetical protein FQA39_LY06012 [Lamprigera yunnana]|nr:hypothetical protein FQA39_LY06012 [Lamprigera yunnana]